MGSRKMFPALYGLAIFVLCSHLTVNGSAQAENPENRALLFKTAMLIRYGRDGRAADPHSAVPLFEKLSEGPKDKIAIEALCELGIIYLFGYRRFFSLKYDLARATQYFETAAQLGHSESQYFMSFLHSYNFKHGPGVDRTKALSYLKDSARSNYTPAVLALAYQRLYRDVSTDAKSAISLYKKIMSGDEAPSTRHIFPLEDIKFSSESLAKYKEKLKQNALEKKLLKERNKSAKVCPAGKKGTEKACVADDKKRDREKKVNELLDQYAKTEPENLPLYLVDIALMYLNGLEVRRNYEHAVQLLEKALELGSNEAANLLGTIYFFGLQDPEEGRSIPVDLDRSLKYFKISAAAHDPESLYYLAEIVSIRALSKGASNFNFELPQSYELYRLSADYGYSLAYLRCAQMLETGLGVEKDLVKAALNYKTYAEQGLIHHTLYPYFDYLLAGNEHAATVLNYMAGYSGVAWNAAMMVRANGSKAFAAEDAKTLFNEALLQGETDSLFYLAEIAERERKLGVARELYRRGFDSGDIGCLDPLIKMYSCDDLDRAVGLVEYKRYRNDIGRNSGRQGLVSSYCNSLSASAGLAFLKLKRAIYGIF